MALLEVRDLHLGYGSARVVRGLQLEVEAGEVVGLIGANGAGKTTALLGIMGAVEATAGSVVFDGTTLTGRPPELIARLGIGLVPEGRRIFSDFTVRENLRLGILSRDTRESADEDLAWVHQLFPIIEEFGDRPAGQLSGGQQQQLAIARALVSRPRLLLLDEPSLGLAPIVVDEMFNALTEVRQRGMSILLVEQRAERTVAFADRTLVMRTGEIVMTVEGDESVTPQQLAAGYFG